MKRNEYTPTLEDLVNNDPDTQVSAEQEIHTLLALTLPITITDQSALTLSR